MGLLLNPCHPCCVHEGECTCCPDGMPDCVRGDISGVWNWICENCNWINRSYILHKDSGWYGTTYCLYWGVANPPVSIGPCLDPSWEGENVGCSLFCYPASHPLGPLWVLRPYIPGAIPPPAPQVDLHEWRLPGEEFD